MKVVTDAAIKETAKHYFYKDNPVGRTALLIVDEILENTPEKVEDDFYRKAWLDILDLDTYYHNHKMSLKEIQESYKLIRNNVKAHLKQEEDLKNVEDTVTRI